MAKRLPQSIEAHFRNKGIGLQVSDTINAAATFIILVGERRKVGGSLDPQTYSSAFMDFRYSLISTLFPRVISLCIGQSAQMAQSTTTVNHAIMITVFIMSLQL